MNTMLTFPESPSTTKSERDLMSQDQEKTNSIFPISFTIWFMFLTFSLFCLWSHDSNHNPVQTEQETRTLFFSAGMTQQQAHSQCPLVAQACTTSPPTYLWTWGIGHGSTWLSMVRGSAELMRTRTTMERMIMPRLAAVDWLSWRKVSSYSKIAFQLAVPFHRCNLPCSFMFKVFPYVFHKPHASRNA